MRAILFVPMLLAALSGLSLAQTVKVGVINTYSGPLAAGGEQIERGIRLERRECPQPRWGSYDELEPLMPSLPGSHLRHSANSRAQGDCQVAVHEDVGSHRDGGYGPHAMP